MRMQRLALFLFVVSALAQLSASVEACGCRPPQFARLLDGSCVNLIPAPASCRVSVSTVLLERQAGMPSQTRVSFSIRNEDAPPGTRFDWTLTVLCGRHVGGNALSTVQAAKMGTLKSSAAAGTAGSCPVTYETAAGGEVQLDPVGLTEPTFPSAHVGSVDLSVACPSDGDSATCAIQLLVIATAPDGTDEGICLADGSFELLPVGSFGDCQVPTVESLQPVTCAKSDQVVPVSFRVRRNEFPADRLPLIATVAPSNVVDSTDLFGVFPTSVSLDFDGGTSQEEIFRIGCHSHGPCWQGVSNELRVTLTDRDGLPVVTATDVQRAEVVVCETPPLRKTLVGQEGDELIYHLTVRNTSLVDVMQDVTVVDRFPNQRILSVRGAVVDWPFDDDLGFVTPIEDRLVDAEIRIRNSRLEISGLDVAVRDFGDIRLLPDTVVFEVRTRVQGLQLCGEVEINGGAELTARYLVDDDGDGLGDREVPVAHVTDPVVANCVCPLGQGYWSTHHRLAQSAGLLRDWPIDESTELCGRSWLEILQSNAAPGDAWTILAFQWIAAELNAAEGAPMPGGLDAVMAEAGLLLEACAIDDADRSRALGLKDLLEAWNTDTSSPGACTELF